MWHSLRKHIWRVSSCYQYSTHCLSLHWHFVLFYKFAPLSKRVAENISERRPVFIFCSSPLLPQPKFVWKWIQPKSKIWQTNSILADHNGQSYFDNRSSSATATAIINARTTISRVNESKRKILNSLKTNIGISISIRKSIHQKKNVTNFTFCWHQKRKFTKNKYISLNCCPSYLLLSDAWAEVSLI